MTFRGTDPESYIAEYTESYEDRAVAGKLGRFNENRFQGFVPESFRWTDCMSRPGTEFSISENVSR